jgi:hypothetical protein
MVTTYLILGGYTYFSLRPTMATLSAIRIAPKINSVVR